MLSIINKDTMSHKEIAKLVESRDDTVKKSMQRLSDKGVIQLTPMTEVNHLGQSVATFHVNERDSYIVVAQLSPEFTAFLVDEWQKRKTPKWVIELSPEARIAIDDLSKQRDDAIKTKAQINDKRTATLMNKASQDAKKIKKLESKLQSEGEYISIGAAGLPERIDTEFRMNVQAWRILVPMSKEMGLPPIKVSDPRYRNGVNTYHVDVIEAFKQEYL